MSIVTEPVARYFPLTSGHYAIKPGFYRLGHDFGNGAADSRLFQLDRQFDDYRQAKLNAREDDPDKYISFTTEGRQQEPALNRFIITRLCAEYPDHFRFQQSDNMLRLDCLLTGDLLEFTLEGRYLDCCPGNNTVGSPYQNGLDALAMQIQEDLALICLSGDENRLCAIHLCHPNHWDARQKIGRDFVQIHQPVPGMEHINRHASQLLQASQKQGPFVRFAWGIASDARLNHHPVPPADVAPVEWQGRAFDPAAPAAWLRVERQTLQGIPSTDAVLFGIRTYLYPLTSLSREEQRQLYQAIEGMDAASLKYKGLAKQQRGLLAWLHTLCGDS